MPDIKSPLLITREEHDETLLAKKTSLVSAATIYAVVNVGTGGTSSTDDSGFTVGTDAGTPFLALADETSPDLVDEGDVGVPRMSLDRILKVSVETITKNSPITIWSRDAGSVKTFLHRNLELSTSSVATLYVATETFKITNLVINSNATVRVAIKSGVTYLTGNASIGVVLNPGGGWVENGSPRSPLYFGLATDQGIVVEKFDMTATAANVSGKVIFIDE